jgi:cyclophilin family peptidyl-prolyl cis-trans isomerase
VRSRRWYGLGGAAAVVVLVGCGLTVDPLAGSPRAAGAGSASSPAPSDAAPAPAGGTRCEYTPSGTAARPVQPPTSAPVPDSGRLTARLATTEGTVSIRLDRANAPCTVHSFESLARQGFYDDTRCHRLVDSRIFILQCGDPTGSGSGGPGYTFPDETDGTESYREGVVAMANAGPNTNGSQFFLIYDDSTSLDATPNYTIFGELDERSRGVVARIGAEGQDGSNPAGGGVPNNPAEIRSVTLS